MAENQIFKATYSGIPVFEMMSKDVAVMRRRSDSWMNATQILKVAGFDKPQRTRILEREVQKGEHEKVQGGYGKYQGTWIPLERGIELAKQYNCEHLLLPLIDFQPDASSPPLAPKHLAAPTLSKPGPRRAEPAVGASTINTRSRRNAPEVAEESDVEVSSAKGSADDTMTPSPSIASSSSRTPSPIRSTPEPDDIGSVVGSPLPNLGRKRKNRADDIDLELDVAESVNGTTDPSTYGDQILEYFISDTNQIPSILVNPPADFDPNQPIDDDGHTALHWAAAMGRVRIVKLLVSAGADIFRLNKAGQTALMRAVMFANNYDVRKFPELYEILHKTTLNIDNYNRTVFHHIVDVAMSKGKTHAARYYMETIFGQLAEFDSELADIINFRDEDGETALTIAAKCRSKRLVKLLIDHGADPKIQNNDKKSTEDYILEDERFRSSPVIPSRTLAMSYRNAHAGMPHGSTSYDYDGSRPPLHYSVTGQKAATSCVNDVTALLESLANSYDQELKEKERDTTHTNGMLQNVQAEILEDQRGVAHLKNQAHGYHAAKRKLQDLEAELRGKMGRRYRLGWEKWVKDDEDREKRIRDAHGGDLGVSFVDGIWRTPEGEDVTDLVELYKDVPSDPAAMKEECDRLRGEIGRHKRRRLETFDGLVKLQAEAGTGGRMADYRRLIGSGCGVAPGDVDNVLGILLETLESEDPNVNAWGGTTSNAKSVG
ncbi:transcription factor [Abortiporus biennis]|nr:transcription factor [Abortiporus biennis]